MGTFFRGPDDKDPTIWGTILGSPIFGNSHLHTEHRELRIEPVQASTCSLHCSSFLGLPYRILIIYLVKPKKEIQWRL